MRSSCLRCCGISAAQPGRAAGQRRVCAGGLETAPSASRRFSLKIVFAARYFTFVGRRHSDMRWRSETPRKSGRSRSPRAGTAPSTGAAGRRDPRWARPGRAAPKGDTWLRVGFVGLHPRCAYVCGYGCASMRVRTGSYLSRGRGATPRQSLR